MRIWLNHWFSTAYHIIKLLKNDTDFTVVGSSGNPNRVYKAVCDEWFTEPPELADDDYVNFCLETCRTKNIDVFVPGKNMLAVASRLGEFETLGVKVLTEKDTNTLEILNDKGKTYQFLHTFAREYVPPYAVVNTAEEFSVAYNHLKTSSNHVCVKYACDEGAASFRVIDENSMAELTETFSYKTTYDTVFGILSRKKKFADLIVMPYLDGTEVSIDCLQYGGIYVPRFKSGFREDNIRYDDRLITFCRELAARCALEMPFNVQFKFYENKPYLLEVNTRMSGGIQKSCLASGVNIPQTAVNRLLGIFGHISLNKREVAVSYIEEPVLL